MNHSWICSYNISKKLFIKNLDSGKCDFDIKVGNNSPFLYICENAPYDITKLVLDRYGKDHINDCNEGCTVFHSACMNDDSRLIDDIIALKPDIDIHAVSDTGHNAVFYAIISKNLNSVKKIIEMGVDPTHISNDSVEEYDGIDAYTCLSFTLDMYGNTQWDIVMYLLKIEGIDKHFTSINGKSFLFGLLYIIRHQGEKLPDGLRECLNEVYPEPDDQTVIDTAFAAYRFA